MYRPPPTALRTNPRQLSSPLRQRGGFSLIEILVVVILIGVGTALTLPKISSITNQTKVRRAAQALQMEVQQAFAIAGRNRTPVTLRWNSTTMQMQITDLAGNRVYRRTGFGRGNEYGFTAGEVTVSPVTLTVFPGGLANDSLVIAVSRRGYSRTVRVSRSGMLRTP
ncbi:MAG: prepilin-type N-terminal cleavage/methylation domain-containing protein [Gemmatimonadaceae bacterium]